VSRSSRRRRLARVSAGIAVALTALTAAACAAQDPLSEQDRNAIAQLAEIAPRDSKIDGKTTEVECWKPSESMLDDEKFRVLCRVHYDQAGTERYRDMICIGDVTADPVTDYCYIWAYYTDMPRFEDKPGRTAS